MKEEIIDIQCIFSVKEGDLCKIKKSLNDAGFKLILSIREKEFSMETHKLDKYKDYICPRCGESIVGHI